MDEFIEPNPESRRRIFLYRAVFIAAAIGLVLISLAIDKHIKTLPACEYAEWVIPLLYAPPAFGLIVAAWVFHVARLILVHQQFPIPGTLVLKKTKIIRGAEAKRRAIICMILLPLVLAAVIHSIINISKMKASFPVCTSKAWQATDVALTDRHH